VFPVYPLIVKPVPSVTPFITDLPTLSAVVKSPAVVSVQTPVAIAATVGGVVVFQSPLPLSADAAIPAAAIQLAGIVGSVMAAVTDPTAPVTAAAVGVAAVAAVVTEVFIVAVRSPAVGAFVRFATVSPVPKLTPFIIDLPTELAAVKSPAVASCHTPVAICAAVKLLGAV
jgi:hypothetical protein